MKDRSEHLKQTKIRQLKPNNQTLILYTEDCQLAPSEDLFSENYWREKDAISGSASGRGTTLFLNTESGNYILRQYLRGGLIGKVLTDQFWFNGFENTRAWQEMHLLEHMVSLGLPAPEPVAARIVKSGAIYRNQIIIKRIPGAKDLHEMLCKETLSEDIWQKVGRAIKQLHQHQIYHHDLNIKNIMMDEHKKVWLIDFDKCGLRKGEDWKRQNIDRLLRSLHKEQGKMPNFHWTEENWQTLLAGYHSS